MLRPWPIFGLFSLSLLVTGAAPPASQTTQLSAALSHARQEAFKLYSSENYPEAILAYEAAYSIAAKEQNHPLEVQFLTNIASCHYAQARYSRALLAYKKAQEQARIYKLREMETLVGTNQASLYLALGQPAQAADLLAQFPQDGSSIAKNSRMEFFLIQALAQMSLKNEAKAFHFFQSALVEAENPPQQPNVVANSPTERQKSQRQSELRTARVLTVIAEALVQENRFAEAKPFLMESFRIRALFNDKTRYFDVLHLARIARAQHDLATASQLLNIAEPFLNKTKVSSHKFLFHRERALLQIEQGNTDSAPKALKSALDAVRRWRTELAAQDASFLNFEALLNTELQDKFATVLVRPGIPLEDHFLAESSFWLAEEARFSSMRATQFPDLQMRERLPESYWKSLKQLQTLHTNQFAGDQSHKAEIRSLELTLERIELEAGLAVPHATSDSSLAFQRWQSRIPADEAVFSFYLSEPYSLAWMVTRNRLELKKIPGKKQLESSIQCFRQALASRSHFGPKCSPLEIYNNLFGEFSSSVRTIPYWTMVLDGVLFDLPLSALESTAGKYLVEDHVLRILPSALFLKGSLREEVSKVAIGIADPIYNAADSRINALDRTQNYAKKATWNLNRLPSSAIEVQNSFASLQLRGWKSSIHSAHEANPAALRSALESSVDVVHISSHVISDQQDPSHVSIVLSWNSETARPTLFTHLDFNNIHTNTKLLVLSGCRSAEGASISGIGLNGLSRAALIAGARGVIATLWPVEDSAGPLFQLMYQELPDHSWNSRSVAESLRRAQLKMLRRGDWFAQPSYWASYIAISRG